MEYAEITCYNCGNPGHLKQGCPMPKACFICKKPDHEYMTVQIKSNHMRWRCTYQCGRCC
jgi:hypothetical protein